MTESAYPFVFYQFRINPPTGFAEAEMSLQLALVALEGLYGEARIRLEARYHVDEPRRTLSVDVRTGAGEALAQIFASMMIREFGNDSFSVARIAAENAGVVPASSLPAVTAQE